MRLEPSHRSSPLATARRHLRVNPSRSETHVEAQARTLVGVSARQLYHATRTSLVPPDRAKLRDYIEVTLHCKEASPLAFNARTSCWVPIPALQQIASITTVTRSPGDDTAQVSS